MSQPYPIADQRSLDPAARRGPLGLKGKSRTTDELPKAFAHQVLVYRVEGRYRIDDAGGFGPAHDDVVNATHVSVVDVSRDRPVLVELDIPSQDALDFRVRVTFVCTVTDPLVVVREGLYDAESALLGYLKRHHKILHLGLGYQITQINSVRRDVNAEIIAYSTIRPPSLPGMSVAVASVEVVTPEVLAEFEGRRRDQRQAHALATEQQGFQHELDQDQRRYEQTTAYRQLRHDQLMETEGQRHGQLLRQEATEFQRRELAKAMSMIDADPVKALQYAFAAGELSADELAGRLREEKDRQAADDWRRLDREREERLAELHWERESRLREESQTLEERRFVRDIKIEVLRDLVKRGHLDMVDLDDLTREILGELKMGSSEAAGELPGPSDFGEKPGPSLTSAEIPTVREEDGD